DDPPSHPTQRERDLLRLLDRLAGLVSQIDPRTWGAADFDSDAPRESYEQAKAYVGERFSSLGYYTTLKPARAGVDEPKPTLGDAVADLTDLLLDLREVADLWQRHGEAAGLVQFYELYWVNWGRAARDLQRLLHDRLQRRYFGD